MSTASFRPRSGGDKQLQVPQFVAAAVWRREPLLLRQAVPPDVLASFGREKIETFVSRLPHMRVFVSDERSEGAASRLVPGEQALAILQRLMASALRYTLLLNRVETVDHDVVSVRELMGVPYTWRVDDIVVTWSTRGSGIGYHAGHEDAIIVQASGRRRWRVWSADAVEVPLRRRILISAPGDNNVLTPTGAPPILDCELQPGDALYIPPFFPHEGVTLDDSISIALGWRGVAYFHMVDAFRGLLVPPDGLDAHALPDAYFELIPDIDPGSPATSQHLVADEVVARLIELGCSVPEPAALAARIHTVLTGVKGGAIP